MSPPHKEESGPRDRDRTRNSSTTTSVSVAEANANARFDTWVQAAEIVSAAWEPYGELMRQAGYAARDQLCIAGECQTAEQIQVWLGIARAGLDLPTQSELAKARRYDDQPCPRYAAGCTGCSRCFRYQATLRNLAAYGQVDFPGRAA